MARVSGQPQHRILFLLDEMAQLGRMDILADAVAIMRGYGMTMWIILQNLSQIKSLYPENRWEIFVANSVVQQYFGVADLDTAEYVSKRLGTSTVDVTTIGKSTTTGRSDTTSWNWSSDNTSSSDTSSHGRTSTEGTSITTTEQLRPLLRPEEVMQLDYHDALVFVRRSAPILSKRVEYFAEPYCQALVEGRSLENAEIVKIEPTPNPLRLISNLFKKERN